MKLFKIADRVIEYSFYLLLFLVPLILTPLNYELFEYNKMMLTYALTIIIIGAWAIKMIINKRLEIQHTPLDIPIFLFLLSQILSYLFSLDRHVSFWGYYSRFHGGLLSTLSYLFLYWALVSNLDKQKVLNGLRLGLLSGGWVAAYGVAEHFGIDAQYWVQDVKNRVFSTLGQPNWLAAYLSILIPIAIAFGLENSKSKALNPKQSQNSNSKIENPKSLKHLDFGHLNLFRISSLGFWIYFLAVFLFYLCLLYTKSRSGFLGFWVGNLIFWVILFFQFRKKIVKWLLIFNFSFLIFNYIVGSPFAQINRYFSFSALQEKITHVAPPPAPPPQPGGTESGDIRKIVWKGAIEIFKHYPLFGSGVETFAFSYYQFRPVEHNLVSEWDFLYNKAHNEYLNYLATTGAFGLGSYLLLIGWFAWWNKKQISNFKFLISKQIPNPKSQKKLDIGHSSEISNWSLVIALFAGYVSILVSNFFGFSVVAVALFFFLIPAFSFILSGCLNDQKTWAISFGKLSATSPQLATKPLTTSQWIVTCAILFAICYLLFAIFRLWLADVYFARGYNFNRIEDYNQAYGWLKQAIETNPSEPLYHDELSSTAATLAIQFAQEKEATRTATLAQEAIQENQRALEISPQNVNFWKTRTRVLYTLSALNEEYNQEALEAIKKASELAPTDAKVFYNLAILYGRTGENDKAIKTLKKTIELKPDYRDARYALALYLKTEGKNEEAVQELKYILEKISGEDEQVKATLQEWGVKN